MEPSRITITDAITMMDRGKTLIFLDSRNPTAWRSSDVKLPGAIRVPADEVEQQLQKIPQTDTVVPYCT